MRIRKKRQRSKRSVLRDSRFGDLSLFQAFAMGIESLKIGEILRKFKDLRKLGTTHWGWWSDEMLLFVC